MKLQELWAMTWQPFKSGFVDAVTLKPVREMWEAGKTKLPTMKTMLAWAGPLSMGISYLMCLAALVANLASGEYATALWIGVVMFYQAVFLMQERRADKKDEIIDGYRDALEKTVKVAEARGAIITLQLQAMSSMEAEEWRPVQLGSLH